jgi:1,4-dihydroxy-2-naphthoyl-CoA hydrolase
MTNVPDLSPQALGPFLRAVGLELETTTGEEVTGTVDAGPDHHTPWGVVHGGLYATIVETAASIGASLAVADRGMFSMGLSNHTDFLRAHRAGPLSVRAWPVHQGRTGQLWQCDVTREDGKLVAQGRVRLQNVELPSS